MLSERGWPPSGGPGAIHLLEEIAILGSQVAAHVTAVFPTLDVAVVLEAPIASANPVQPSR